MKQLTLLALLFIPVVAAAADTRTDSSFYRDAAQGGLAEVEAGRLAQEKSSNQKIKDFAAMMVKDHSAANEELKSVAASENVTLPSSPSVAQRANKVKLEVLSGDSFDKAYIKNQIAAHKSTVALLQKEIASGQSNAGKTFAHKVLPTVRSHLKAITEISQPH